LTRDALDGGVEETQHELLQPDLATRIVDVDPDQIAVGVVGEHDAGRDFSALRTGLLGEVDVERIRVGMVVELHGTNPQSRTAL